MLRGDEYLTGPRVGSAKREKLNYAFLFSSLGNSCTTRQRAGLIQKIISYQPFDIHWEAIFTRK